MIAAPADQAERNALQHHLGAEEHDDHVPPDEKADEAQGEQHAADGQML